MATPRTVAFYTLGCKLNYSETSAIGRTFEDRGYAEVKFEELTKSPEETIAKIYEQLELGNSTQVVESTEKYFAQRSSHKKNKHDTEHLVESINEHWAQYMEQFGYTKAR